MRVKDEVKVIDHQKVILSRNNQSTTLCFEKGKYFATVELTSEPHYPPVKNIPLYFENLDDAITAAQKIKYQAVKAAHLNNEIVDFPLPSIVQRNGKILNGGSIERLVG